MSAIQCKYINNINIFSFLGWRKMTQKQKMRRKINKKSYLCRLET